MIDSKYRNLYQRYCIAPLLRLPVIAKLSPNILTLSACFCGVGVAPLIVFDQTWAALGALLLSGFLDTLDGSLARHTKSAAPGGAVLDICCDRLVEFSIVVGLYLVAPASRGLLSLFMLGSILLCITTFLVVGIFSQNESEKSFHYSPGLIERSEAFLFFALMILFPAFFPFLAILFTILVAWTAGLRVLQFSSRSTSNL